MGSERTFELGAGVWDGLIDNLGAKTIKLNPRDRIGYRRTVSWPLPSDLVPPAAPTGLFVR